MKKWLFIAGLIFVALITRGLALLVYGAYLLIKHKREKITRAMVSIGFGALILVAALSNNQAASSASPPETSAKPVTAATQAAPAKATAKTVEHKAPVKPQPKPAAKPAPLPLDQAIRKAVTDAIGSRTNDDKYPRIADLMILPDDQVNGASNVVIEVNANENLTDHMTAQGMLMDATKIFQAIFPRGYITKVTLNFDYDMTNAYGQTSHENVMQIILTKDTYKKINWDNFDYNNFPSIADDFQADPAVQKALQQ